MQGKMETKGTLTLRIRKRQLKILGYFMRKEGSKNLKLTGPIEGKSDKEKQHITNITNLCQWLSEQVSGQIES